MCLDRGLGEFGGHSSSFGKGTDLHLTGAVQCHASNSAICCALFRCVITASKEASNPILILSPFT